MILIMNIVLGFDNLEPTNMGEFDHMINSSIGEQIGWFLWWFKQKIEKYKDEDFNFLKQNWSWDIFEVGEGSRVDLWWQENKVKLVVIEFIYYIFQNFQVITQCIFCLVLLIWW